MAKTQGIRTGTIIWANVADPISHAPVGEHAAIVLNPQNEIDAGFDLDVYVCTTSFRNRQPGWFDVPTELDSSRDRLNPQTRLPKAGERNTQFRQKSAAKNLLAFWVAV